MRIHVINGPNLNLLGTREPEIYGRTTLPELEQRLAAVAEEIGVTVECEQHNGEGEIVSALHRAAAAGADGVLLNAGGYSHTSVAIRDAIRATQLAVVEVHVSNVFARERFRHHSHIAPVARAVVVGFGVRGYELALMGLVASLRE